jgi:hypothetical protein
VTTAKETGKVGGKARAANMTPEERTVAARHAANAGLAKLTPEQRSERAAKGQRTRREREEKRRLRALKGAATKKARRDALRDPMLDGPWPLPDARPMAEAPPVVQALAKVFDKEAARGKFMEMAARAGPLPVSMLACREAPRLELYPTLTARVLAELEVRQVGQTEEHLARRLGATREQVRNALRRPAKDGRTIGTGKGAAKVWRLA